MNQEERHHEEEDYFGRDRKMLRMERKIASAKDRSKYKKTDRNKRDKEKKTSSQIHLPKEQQPLLRARVLSTPSQGIIVQTESTPTEVMTCSLRGILKKEKNRQKNLVIVGDYVLLQQIAPSEGVITYIEPRQSTLSRADNLSRNREQLIAANIEQVLITISVVSPPLKPFLTDRYVIAAYKGRMTPIIVVNKIDLLESQDFSPDILSQEKQLYTELIEAYKLADITVVPVSASTGCGLEELQMIMKNKSSVFAGQSGVGKSSLISKLTGTSLRVGTIVEKTQKGSHTTTSAHLVPLSFGGWCIDTPGIKSFGIWDLKQEEIASYYSEIEHLKQGCKFPNCTHTHEEGCAVIQALKTGEMSSLRYQAYTYLRNSVAQEHKRR